MQIRKAYLFGKQITAGVIPPEPIPDWWINSAEVDPTYAVDEYRPYIQEGRYQQCYNIYADFAYAYSQGPQFCINGGTEIAQPSDEYTYDIPLYDANENLSSYKIRYVIGVSSSEPDYRPQSGVLLYNGDTLIDQVGGVNNWAIDHPIYKVLAYAGANKYRGMYGAAGKKMLYGGLAIIMVNVENGFGLVHLGAAIDLDWLETTYGVHLGSEWLTPTN